jgi:2',3'-cyclic-nucleotide 2'-phosphodiesterase (5'-nucleotidase family)
MHVIGSLAVTDASGALQTCLKELQGQTNIIILLSNLGWEANLQLADTISGVDLIVSAGPGQVVIDPWRSTKTGTLVVQDGVYPQANPGQTAADVQMQVDGAGVVTSSSGTQVVLGPEYDDDEQVRKLLTDYQLMQ